MLYIRRDGLNVACDIDLIETVALMSLPNCHVPIEKIMKFRNCVSGRTHSNSVWESVTPLPALLFFYGLV